MQNQVFEMRTADSMVMEWNIYMHVIDFSFTMQEVRYGSLKSLPQLLKTQQQRH